MRQPTLKFGDVAMNKRKKSSLTWMFGVVVLVANALLHVGAAYAQFGSASVLGYVRDNTDAVVPNAIVKLNNVATNVSQTAKTDNEGKYEFNSVPLGNYQISTEAAGLQGAKQETFNLSTDSPHRVDLQ